MSFIDSLGEKEEIQTILKSGGFLRDVEAYLKQKYPRISRGISRRSIRRYCSANDLNRFLATKLDKKEKEKAIRKACREVGPTYGASTLQGYLRSKGVQVSKATIHRVQKKADPRAFQLRKNDLLDKANPIPYFAPYFGYRGHLDQNEKLVMYGVVHVVIRDGHSGFIENWITLPSKNPIKLYSQFFRPILLKTGIFDQLRVDMGKEWVLILFIQEVLKRQRQEQKRSAHVKTTSKKNLTIERVWPEVNARVNYPIKRILIEMDESGALDMTNEHVQFCVSWFSCEVAKVGMKRFVAAWNSHKIKGKRGNGVPMALKEQTNKLKPLRGSAVPTERDAVAMYEAQGGKLQTKWWVGKDELSEHTVQKQLRELRFYYRYSFDDIFTAVVGGNDRLFKKALQFYISL